MNRDEKLIEEINQLNNNTNIDPNFLQLHVKILTKKNEFIQMLSISEKEKGLILMNMESKINAELPILDTHSLDVKEDIFKKVFLENVSIMLQVNNKFADDLNKLEKLSETNLINYKKIISDILDGDDKYIKEFSMENGLEPNLLKFLIKILFAPVFQKYAEFLKLQFNENLQFTGKCPVCGNIAGMARLKDETGERILWCSLCHTEWPHKRIRCIHCGNEDQTQLGYFYLNDTSHLRVDICEKCNKYIKTVDERKLNEGISVLMNIEEISSYDLDIIAEQEGYLAE